MEWGEGVGEGGGKSLRHKENISCTREKRKRQNGIVLQGGMHFQPQHPA